MLNNLFFPANVLLEAQLRIARLEWLTEAELAYQRQVLKARLYHEGDQASLITEQVRAFLNLDNLEEEPDFNVNVYRIPTMAVVERIGIEGFESMPLAFGAWFWQKWGEWSLGAVTADLHEHALAEGEYFLFIQPDPANARVEYLPHYRFTDAAIGGTGDGCAVFYPNNNLSQEPAYAIKIWEELQDNGSILRHKNIYFPDHFQRFADVGAGWEPFVNDGGQFEYPWLTRTGEPIGIPIIHFYNRGMRPEAWSARALQDILVKLYIDLLLTSDIAGFPVHFLFGASGKNADGTPIRIKPGTIIAFPERKPGEAGVTTPTAADLTQLMNLKNDIVADMASVTDTPLARFQRTGQIAAADTIKEQDAPLAAKIEARTGVFGTQWGRAAKVTRNVYDTFIAQDAPPYVPTRPKWKNPFPRSGLEVAQEVGLKRTQANISLQQGWRDLGYSEQQIEQMMLDKEQEAMLAQRVAFADMTALGAPPAQGGQ